ncbi:17.3 kDa class II heat shock protein-like [Diospyros lotus]|uniref:17.3 kDa class II heat shock protein-like n=1 Tax=Diospyros lotus TaxID=55363 RepID=UPI00225983E7|nr:17.3 kDa class II heat shock protein-like [Diospyros lotus]
MEFRIIGCANSDENQPSAIRCPVKRCGGDTRSMAAATATPPVDVMEYPNSYVFAVDVPGLKSGDVKVEVEDANILTISGERKRHEKEMKNEEWPKYLKLERKAGKFTRKFVLPENANADSISAVCRNGILTVTVEKMVPAEPKTIQVQVA